MNKTLKTVLITTGVIFVALFAIVMIFGEDNLTPTSPSTDLAESSTLESDNNAPLKTDDKESPVPEVSKEVFEKTVSYDIFDWNMADDKGKMEIVEAIITVWAANGNVYEQTPEDLLAGIKQELQKGIEQANIFEKACNAAQIDFQPYYERAE
ncbi:MAG: hypothetical protein WAX04_03275 [Oscillospiraceae bacterium]